MKRALSLTALLALGGWLGCAVDRSGLQTPAVTSAGGDDGAIPMGGAAAVAGASGSGTGSVDESGKPEAPGADAEVGLGSDAAMGLGNVPSDVGGPGGDAYVAPGPVPSGSGGSGGDAVPDLGGAPSGGASGGEGGAPSGGASGSEGGAPSGGASGSEGGAPSGGASGSDAGEGSDSASGGSTSGRDAGLVSNDGATRDGPSGSDAGFDAGISQNWHLVWSDDFDLGLNVGADTTKWNVATSDPGTVNAEQQKYTARAQNVFHDGQGHLVLRGLHDFWRSNGTTYPYTSGRLQSDGKFTLKFGRVEVRAKLPAGKGSYPAILLMGTTGDWPQCGEIGIMEQRGQDKSWLYCSTYSGAASDFNQKVTADTSTTDFHVYALEWYSDHMVFFIDDVQVARSNFDKTSPFYTGTYYLILDVAIGGTIGGPIDDAGGFPMDMVLDYVRVYAQP